MHLRTWRPSVIVLDDPKKDDAASNLLNEAALKAVDRIMVDAVRSTSRSWPASHTWSVERVFLRLPIASKGRRRR